MVSVDGFVDNRTFRLKLFGRGKITCEVLLLDSRFPGASRLLLGANRVAVSSGSEKRLWMPDSWDRAVGDAVSGASVVCISFGGDGVESLLIKIASGQVFASEDVIEDIMSKTSGSDERRLGEADILTSAGGQDFPGIGSLCYTLSSGKTMS